MLLLRTVLYLALIACYALAARSDPIRIASEVARSLQLTRGSQHRAASKSLAILLDSALVYNGPIFLIYQGDYVFFPDFGQSKDQPNRSVDSLQQIIQKLFLPSRPMCEEFCLSPASLNPRRRLGGCRKFCERYGR